MSEKIGCSVKKIILSLLLVALFFCNMASFYRGFIVPAQNPVTSELCINGGKNGSSPRNVSEAIQVAFFGKYAFRNMKIVRGMARTFNSILRNTRSPLHLHVLLDLSSKVRVGRTLRKVARGYHRKLNVSYYDVDEMADNFRDVIDTMKKYFFSKDVGRYNDDIFFMSEIFHRALSMQKIIFLDLDLKFMVDIQQLQDEFLKFHPLNVMGIAPDLQPQYRVDFGDFRSIHPGTVVGSPRPGRQGFNTGVVLFHLERMRKSTLYNHFLNESVIEHLCDKYSFNGYLGHQDFFTLTGMEYPELYYQLDCTWNRQLDKGWRKNVGGFLFDLYHACRGDVKIYHGNGDAHIPGD